MPAATFIITEQNALEMPRFDFIAHWLVKVTGSKKNRGRLGLWVRRRGKAYEVVSPIGGSTVTYATRDPALLFDYVRRGELGTQTREADKFRELSYMAKLDREARAKTPTQIESEIAELMETDR